LTSVAVTVTLYGLPTLVVGVPLMVPELAPMVKPGGSPLAENVSVPVPPVAVTVVAV
jgi:hypothetical protein